MFSILYDDFTPFQDFYFVNFTPFQDFYLPKNTPFQDFLGFLRIYITISIYYKVSY